MVRILMKSKMLTTRKQFATEHKLTPAGLTVLVELLSWNPRTAKSVSVATGFDIAKARKALSRLEHVGLIQKTTQNKFEVVPAVRSALSA